MIHELPHQRIDSIYKNSTPSDEQIRAAIVSMIVQSELGHDLDDIDRIGKLAEFLQTR
jgi:hypothetical protein